MGKLSSQNWEDNHRSKILIQTNEFFRHEIWCRKFDSVNNVKSYAQIKYTSSRTAYYRLAESANIIFAFNFNSDLLVSNKALRLFYLGVRGGESLPTNGFHQVSFYTVPPFGKDLIAEYVLAALIILDRKLYHSFRNQYKGVWSQKGLLGESVPGITKKRIGIAGMGNIGKSISNLLSKLGLTVVGWDKLDHQTNIRQYIGMSSLYDFLNDIDILIISLPLNDETRLMFNYDALVNLKKGSAVINVSRGGIIDESALLMLLKANHISGAVLDVFQDEPLPKSSKLWKTENLVVTPHISGNVNYFVDDVQKDFLDKLISHGLLHV